MALPRITVTLPDWLEAALDSGRRLASDDERMRFVIELARENVLRDAGGPFAAAVFESASGRLVAAGVNRVIPLGSSVLHAEIVAFLMAQEAVGRHRLDGDGLPAHELVTSCEPCAMCLGATLWSGVRRLVCGARREDAQALAFDEGPVFPESYAYLDARGVEVVRGVCPDEARAVLELYAERGGVVY